MPSLTVYMPLKASYENVAVAGTAVGLSATKYNPGDSTSNFGRRNAETALITVEGDSVHWTVDGTTPTATIGHLATAGSAITLEGYDTIRNFRAIQTATAAVLHVTYFGG
jgi:hypothetical protein